MRKMDSSESISSSMDTTTDSIDVSDHFAPKDTLTKPSNLSPRKVQVQQRQKQKEHQKQQQQQLQEQEQQQLRHQHRHHDKQRFQRRLTIFESDTHRYEEKTILLNSKAANNLDYHNEDTIPDRVPPLDNEEYIIVDDTPPPSTSSVTTCVSQNNNTSPTRQRHLNNNPLSSSASTSSLNTFMTCCSENMQDEADLTPSTSITTNDSSPGVKSVKFDRVTVYHFIRSQGFTSVPSQGGSTLGMKRRHFLRRRLTVDLYEEVRRQSRRQIFLKIKLEKRKRARQLQLQLHLNNQHKSTSPTLSQTSSNKTENQNESERQRDTQKSRSRISSEDDDDNDDDNGCASDTNGDKRVGTIVVDGDDDENENEDEEDFSYSDESDISDSDLEGDSRIFVQPIPIKIRRSLLRASGVYRIDPIEKKDCKRIRESREKSGCKCVGQCLPEYCECSRLGVRCHVDRASYPCGCVSDGCKNPEGRTEFDIGRVRKHFEEKIFEAHHCSDSPSCDEELLTTTPTSSTTSEESC